MVHKLSLAVCRNFEKEAAAVLASPGFEEVTAVIFPHHCGGSAQVDWQPLLAAMGAAQADGREVCLVGGGCLAARRDLPEALAALRPQPNRHCLSNFAGETLINNLVRNGAYLMTPGWLANWREYLRNNGFDRRTAREFFGETTQRLVLLDTGVDAEAAANLREFADYLGLPGEMLPVGLDYFRLFLTDLISKKRLAPAPEQEAANPGDTGRPADYAMALDLMGRLTEAKTEAGVIELIFELFQMVCAPAQLLFVSVVDGRAADCRAYPETLKLDRAALARLGEFTQDYAWTESGQGFRLRLGSGQQTLGVLEVEGLALPQYREHYLNLGLNSIKVCSLALRNAQAYEKIEQTLKERQRLLELLQQQSEELQAANEEFQTQNEELQDQAEELARQNEELELLSQQLSQAKEDWERTFDAVPDLITILDTDHHIVRVNRAAARALGTESQDLAGRPCYEVMHECRRIPDQCPHQQMLLDGREHAAELREFNRDLLVTTSPILDAGGQLLGSVHVARDITERKRTEEALHRLTEELEQRIEARTAQLVAVYGQLDAFFTHSITPMVFLDQNFNFIRVNEAYARACQRRAADFPGHNHFEFYPHAENQAIFAEVARTKQPYQAMAKPFEFPDHPEWGVTYWDWTLMPILDEAGEIDFLVFSLKDVTERRRAEEALEFERRRFFEVLERIPAHVSLLRQDHTFAFVNGEFVRRFGEPGAKRCHELMGRQHPCEECRGMQVFHTGAPVVWEWTSPAGRHYQNYHYPFTDVDGSPLVLEMGVDITERKQAEQELQALNEDLEGRVRERTAELEFANRELESFAYSVSHDLKAPIRAIQGFSRMLLGEHAARLDKEGRRLLQVVIDNTRTMANLIDDLLALSRVGRHQIRESPLDLAAVARRVFERLREQEADRDLRLTIQDLPAALGDPALIQQVMMNLLGNAIKYTRTSKTAVIEVGGYAADKESVFFVKDNGIGFDARYAHKLFGVFQRLHGGREYEGTGVGLAIVQRIIQRHGGRVWAEGNVGEGATFYFTLSKKER